MLRLCSTAMGKPLFGQYGVTVLIPPDGLAFFGCPEGNRFGGMAFPPHVQSFHQSPGGDVVRVAQPDDTMNAKAFEGMVQQGLAGFSGIAASMEADVENISDHAGSELIRA